MNIQPLGDRVVIKVLEKEEKPRAVLSCPILPRKSPRKEKLWLLVPGASPIREKRFL